MSARNNPKDTLFAGMDDNTVIRKFQTRAVVENVTKDVMHKPADLNRDRLVNPTSYKKVK